MTLINGFAESYWLLLVRTVVSPVTVIGYIEKIKHEEKLAFKCVYSLPSSQQNFSFKKRNEEFIVLWKITHGGEDRKIRK